MSRPLSRRRLLELAGVGGVAAVAAGSGGVLVARGGESSDQGTGGTVPFYGDHQAGILTPQQHHLQFASYDVTASNAAELRDLLSSWTGLAARLTRGDDPGSGGGEFAPPDDTGEAGGLDPARLTLTVGFGPGLFDDRFGLAGKRPPELADLPRFEKDELDPAQSGGDICIQACSNDPQVAFHAIRNLTRDGRGGVSLRWLQKGFLSPTDGGAGTPRNLMGFKDGTANLDPAKADRMDRNVWAAPGAGFGWMAGGSYLVARKIRIRIEQWDRTALGEQEKFVGRVKDSGAPLGGTAEHEAVKTSKLDVASHIRLANPRTGADSERERILRRGYNFDEGIDEHRPDLRRALLPRLPAGPAPPVRLDPDAARCQRPAQRVPLPHRQRDLRDAARRPAGRLHRPEPARLNVSLSRAYDAPKRTGRHVIVADYTIKALADVTDFLGDYPGEMRLATYEIGAEQAALTWRRMPAQTGGKGSYGHRHKTQEEIYLVVSGTLQFKLDDDVVDVPAGTVVRVAPAGRALRLERGAGRRRARDRGPEDRRPERRRRARPRLLARVAVLARPARPDRPQPRGAVPRRARRRSRACPRCR